MDPQSGYARNKPSSGPDREFAVQNDPSRKIDQISTIGSWSGPGRCILSLDCETLGDAVALSLAGCLDTIRGDAKSAKSAMIGQSYWLADKSETTWEVGECSGKWNEMCSLEIG